MRGKKKVSGLPIKSEFNARPDTVDFRDKMYVATLIEVPSKIPLETYRGYYKGRVPVLDQGSEGACTGFGLAAVANFLLRQRKVVPDTTQVSPRMMYQMARRYDEWPGEKYEGSSARGAMKAWHKHGVCSKACWPDEAKGAAETLDHGRATDAATRPLGAYFRVNPERLVDMHSALAEVGILYATATVHEGWDAVDQRTGLIPAPNGRKLLGGHAFAIVGYDERGFWIQNSWGNDWGKGGFALVGYDDWLANATDVWVARLGAPTMFSVANEKLQVSVAVGRSEFAFADLRSHVVSIGNNGELRDSGTFGTRPTDLDKIFSEDIPRITAGWPVKRILLYAHGGLVSESAALQRVEDYRKQLLEAQVYPLAFVWKTDAWTTLANILKDAIALRRPEGFLDAAKDFMLDRLDDTLEPLARPLGKALWDEMKENALLASNGAKGGARQVITRLNALISGTPKVQLHVAGHSAGSIFMAPVVKSLTAELGRQLSSVTLWAPACTVDLFKESYLPALQNGKLERFALFTLKDQTERDDNCAGIYHKSLLYLVSNAFEEKMGLFFADGEPILGMEKFILQDRAFKVDRDTVKKTNPSVVRLFGMKNAEWVRSPNGLGAGNISAAEARHHGDFDDDKATVQATLARILGREKSTAHFDFRSSSSALGDRRRRLAVR